MKTATTATTSDTTTVTADNNPEILGGIPVETGTPDTTTNTAPVATTPGKAARKSAAEKRDYTPRGTTYWARRIILLNGKPVGRGRPAKDGKGERKVVYVPVGMDYDAKVHGEGVKYNSHSHSKTHKRLDKTSVSYTFDDGVAPTAKTKVAAKGKAKVVAKGKAKVVAKGKGKGKVTAKGKGKAKKNTVNVAVADVNASAAPVDAAPVDAAPVAA